MPRHEAIRPIAAKTSGKYIIFIRSVSETVSLFAIFERNKLTARIIADDIAPTNDSSRSEPSPATSPTLSPTLSAIVAGFRGSSSGMCASVLPTRSAPISAAFV